MTFPGPLPLCWHLSPPSTTRQRSRRPCFLLRRAHRRVNCSATLVFPFTDSTCRAKAPATPPPPLLAPILHATSSRDLPVVPPRRPPWRRQRRCQIRFNLSQTHPWTLSRAHPIHPRPIKHPAEPHRRPKPHRRPFQLRRTADPSLQANPDHPGTPVSFIMPQ